MISFFLLIARSGAKTLNGDASHEKLWCARVAATAAFYLVDVSTGLTRSVAVGPVPIS